MKNNKSVKGLVFLLGGLVVPSIVLSGCGVYALSDDQKLKRVNPIVEQVDYESAGTVISTEYTGQGGLLAPSSFKAKIKEESDTFNILKQEVLAVEDITCLDPNDTTLLNCKVGVTSVTVVSRDTEGTKYVYFSVTDSSSGRGDEK